MDWLASRHTHAWGSIGVGLTMVIGAVPLAHAVYPGQPTPWWVPAGLVLGAVALIYGLMLFTLPHVLSAGQPDTNSPNPSSGLTSAHQVVIGLRDIRSEIGRCRSMIDEAVTDGYYPWSSSDPTKLPSDVWEFNKIVLAIRSDAADAFHFSSMAYVEFARINRVVAEMSSNIHPSSQTIGWMRLPGPQIRQTAPLSHWIVPLLRSLVLIVNRRHMRRPGLSRQPLVAEPSVPISPQHLVPTPVKWRARSPSMPSFQ